MGNKEEPTRKEQSAPTQKNIGPDLGDVKFVSNNKKEMNMTGLFKDRPIFLVSSGPSLQLMNLDRIREVQAMSFGINNSWSIFKPDIWTCADSPDRFLYSCWKDAQILKLVPSGLRNKNLRFKKDEDFYVSEEKPLDCPNVLYYSRNLDFNHRTFLDENTVNWGCTGDKAGSLGHKGARSVFLSALKLCYVLGFRTVYLCGVDFKMNEGVQNYAFPQERSLSSVKGNNVSYNVNSKRLEELNKLFLRNNYRVFNCNPSSHLKAFPFLSFDEAIQRCSEEIVEFEGSKGWYNVETKNENKRIKAKRN